MRQKNAIFYLALLIISFLIINCNSADSFNTFDTFFQKSIEDYIEKALDFPSDRESETLYRCRYDFNHDGFEDVAISGQYSGVFGSGGGEWIVYFQRDSSVSERCIKGIFMSFHYIGFNENNNLFFFNKFGCCSGELIEYEFSDKSFKIVESKKLEQSDSYDLWIEMDKTFETLKKPIFEKIAYSKYVDGNDWVDI